MGKQQIAKVVSTKEVAINTYEIELALENAKGIVMAGQFLHLKVPNRPDLMLRRPISINSVNKDKGLMTLIVQAKNAGTKALCALPADSEIDVVGPVGKGFLISKEVKKAAVIGGGIGVAPLRYLIEKYPNIKFDSYIGFRGKDFAYQLDVFEKISNLHLVSDDGSIGQKGFATALLDEDLKAKGYDAVYACGPLPMFKALKKVMEKHDVPCFISMEERMGCGIGGCKVCVCKTKDSSELGYDYKKVCQDGPVFNIEEVIL